MCYGSGCGHESPFTGTCGSSRLAPCRFGDDAGQPSTSIKPDTIDPAAAGRLITVALGRKLPKPVSARHP